MSSGVKAKLNVLTGHSAWGVCVYSLSIFALSGCGDFFARKPTEIESRIIINDISQVRENPNIKNPLPEMYRSPAKKLKVNNGVKLFYFTKHHSAGELASNVKELGLNVSHNVSTNQLIIHCTDDVEADKVLDYLSQVDVPPIQINIDCLILERFADVTTDWETTLLIENFLGEGITLGEGKFPNPAFPGARLRESRRGTFGMDFGYWIDQGISGHQVRFIVDMLESRGYLKILINPTLETINGKKATVQIRDYTKIFKTVTPKGGEVDAYTLAEYKWVSDTLTVTPHVYSDGYIGLTTSIKVGSKSKPEGVVQTPILTERSINVAENRIRPGSSLVIGGMRKAENRSVVRGVPFFKDIPLLGILFSSKDFEEKATEIIFILTPTISAGGQDHAEMVEYIKEKHTAPKHETEITEFFTDPFGSNIYSDLIVEQTTKAQVEREKAEMQKLNAQQKQQAEKRRTKKILAEIAAAKAVIETASAEMETAKTALGSAQKQAEAEKAKTIRAQAEKAAADRVRQEAEAVKAAADAAKADLEKNIDKKRP